MNNEINNLNTGVNDYQNNNQSMNNGANYNQNSMPNSEYNPNMNQGFTQNNMESMPQQMPMTNGSLSNDKIVKNLKNDFLVLAILSLIASIGMFILYKEDSTIMIRVGIQIGYTLLLFWGYTMAKQGKKSAGILGIIVGILMILAFFSSIIDALLGLFLLVHSIKYNKLV